MSTIGDMTILSEAIRQARDRAGLSTQAAAAAAGISPAYLNKLETDKVSTPSPHVLQRVSEALNVPYWDLMDHAGYVPTKPPKAGTPRPKREAATNERLLELLLEIRQ